jgi:hypothetical protein
VFRRAARIAVMTLAAGAAAPAAFAQLATLESRDLRLVYISPSEDYLAPFVAQSFRAAQQFLSTLFAYQSDEKLTVLLVDFSDYGNAGASTIPFNTVRIQIAPTSFAFETMVTSERMHALMNHELVHIIAMDQSTRQDRVFRRLFGGKVMPVAEQPESVLYFYLTSPRVAVPRWFLEGAAVFADTWENGGIGRAQGGYDEMVWRAMVRDGARFYDPLGLAAEGSKNTFQVEANSYLYGTRFMTWLAYRYSPAQLIEWVGRRPGSKGYYAAQFRHVFGLSLERAWRDWIAWEREFQAANLAGIRKYPVTPYRDVSDHALGSVSRAWLDESSETLYAGFNAPGAVAHIGSITLKTGARKHLADIKGPSLYEVSSVAYDHAGTIFYTTDNNAHRDLVALDTRSGRVTTLQKDLRAGDLVLNRLDKTLWGVRSLNGLHTLVRIEPPYSGWQQVATFPYGITLYDLDVSSDGTRLAASVGDLNGKQTVRVFDIAKLRAADTTPVAEFDVGGGVPNNFVFSPDGRFLYGTSYFTGVSNVFRYDLAAGKLEAVTNTETGFFRPIPIGGDDLIVFRYTGQGFVPARITARPLEDVAPITFLGERTIARHPVLKTWLVGTAAIATAGGAATPPPPDAAGVYRLGGGLRRESIYPIVQGYKDTLAVGARLNLSDRLQFNRATLALSYSPWGALRSTERLHLRADYERYDWKARASWNNADFYDLFGPTKVGRKGYDVTVGHTNTLRYDQPKLLTLKVEATAAGNLDRLPAFQNVAVDVDRLYSAKAELAYTDVRSSLGHVDDEKGHLWSATAHADYVNARTFLRLFGHYDAGTALPLGHASIWLRTAAGFSPQPASEPFANFFFGGFGNNWIDHGEIKRYREPYAFPGAALNEIGGRNFVRSLVEFALPPVRFSRVGTPGFYLSFLRPAVFAGGLVTNVDDRVHRRTAATMGAQIDLRATVLSSLDLTLSFGAGLRLERHLPARREAMVSLALLK